MKELKEIKKLFDDFIEEAEEVIEKKEEKEDVKYYRCIGKGLRSFIQGRIYKVKDNSVIGDDGCTFVDNKDYSFFKEVKKPKKGDNYWLVNLYGKLLCYVWNNENSDWFNFKSGNFFWTEEEAEEYIEEINNREL